MSARGENIEMRRVTVRVPLEESLDLLERPARACAGFVVDGLPRIEPVRVRYEEGRYLVGFAQDAAVPAGSSEVVLVVDDGTLFFELRAVYVRGVASPAEPEEGSDLRWRVLEPQRVSSWNYGRMRWQRDGS